MNILRIARALALPTAVAAVLAAGATSARSAGSGKVRGTIQVYKTVGGRKVPVSGWDFSHVVVYLIPVGHELPGEIPATHPSFSQKGAKFVPDLVVVTKGQTVDFPNDDAIDHNVFSFSKAKKFDLGVYPKGVKKSVRFDQPGPVLIFCSIHESMNGVVFVTPNSLHAVADGKGEFLIPDVPIGKYRLLTWHSALPEATESVLVREIDVESGKAVEVMIDLSNLGGGGQTL